MDRGGFRARGGAWNPVGGRTRGLSQDARILRLDDEEYAAGLHRDHLEAYNRATHPDALVRAVRSADKAAITGARVFDVFTGAGVEEGFKSVAVEAVLSLPDNSATVAVKV